MPESYAVKQQVWNIWFNPLAVRMAAEDLITAVANGRRFNALSPVIAKPGSRGSANQSTDICSHCNEIFGGRCKGITGKRCDNFGTL
jgi:hypothetical protein